MQSQGDGVRTFDGLNWEHQVGKMTIVITVLFETKQEFRSIMIHFSPFNAVLSEKLHELGLALTALFKEGGMRVVRRGEQSIREDLDKLTLSMVALAVLDWSLEILEGLPGQPSELEIACPACSQGTLVRSGDAISCASCGASGTFVPGITCTSCEGMKVFRHGAGRVCFDCGTAMEFTG